jgi:hypothetical protein
LQASSRQRDTGTYNEKSRPPTKQLADDFLREIVYGSETLRLDEIRYQRYCRGDHNDYRADNCEVFLEFIVRKMAHELPVICQLDQVIKDKWKCDGIDCLCNNRYLE